MHLTLESFKRYILVLLFCSQINTSYAQKKCGTVEFNQLLQKKVKHPESEKTFENWIKTKSQIRKNELSGAPQQRSSTVYTIPVVFHIIHSGEALNSGQNISDEIIIGQLDSLNKDFRRLNADSINTPLDFQPFAADVNIEFVLAKRDPEGLPTTGIIRKQGNQSTYSINDPLTLTQQSYWPTEDYLNFWVTDISSGFLGFAQFPTSNLEGLNRDQSISRLTDGVVIDYKFTGTNYNTGGFASLGRTATHEVGHFLGLRHMWGTTGCGSDDYCIDTPTQDNSTNGCPSEGSLNSCNSIDMFQNFMDYTDDECMNLFTTCQADRMRIIMENSPRRKSLLTSKGAIEPVFVANDLGIREVISPQNSSCTNELDPQLEVRNYGINNITNFTVELLIDGVLIETISKNVNLSYLETDFVAFNSITQVTNSAKIVFQITSTNLGSDGNSENDTKSFTLALPIQGSIPYSENFETDLADWSILNSNFDHSTMVLVNAPNLTLANSAFSFNYYESSSEKYGELDWLISPSYDLSALPAADFNFKYAYAAFSGNVSDVLTVAVSIDCGITFKESDYLFQKFSPNLGTTSPTNQSFVPNGPSDWDEISLNLTDYVGNSNVVIAFIAHNGGGNNLYIDDVAITSNNILAYNLGITKVDFLPHSSCLNDVFPTIEIKNFGYEIINSFDLEYTINGIQNVISTTGTTILPGKTKSILLLLKDLDSGTYQIDFNASNPNGNIDEQSTNNSSSRSFTISSYSDIIPLKENFEFNVDEFRWYISEKIETNGLTIDTINSNGTDNRVLSLKSFNIPELGTEHWLISPQLDLTQSDSASMIFRVSYANILGRNDQLEVKVSTNCGLSFDNTIYSKKGNTLAVTESNIEWFPEDREAWRTEYLDLSSFTNTSLIKIAFVFTNQNGNNIYLDDIEFFNQGTPSIFNSGELSLRIYPNPSGDFFNIKFDLETREGLTLTLIDMAGNIVYQNKIPNILNQEYKVSTVSLRNGIYILHTQGKFNSMNKRIVVNH